MSKVKIKNRMTVALPAALSEIRRLLDELDSGSTVVSDQFGEVEMRPDEEVELKIAAREESGQGKLEFILSWGDHAGHRHHRPRRESLPFDEEDE